MRIAISLVLLLAATATWGEAARRASSDDAARYQQMLQQLNAEKTTLATENAKLKKDLQAKTAELDESKKDVTSNKQKLATTGQDLANTRAKEQALQTSFDTLKGRFDQLVEQYRKTVDVMKGIERERTDLQKLAGDYDARVAMCERNNDALYNATGELIELYEKKGFEIGRAHV